MKLKNIYAVGRYEDPETGKQYNIKCGIRVGRGTSILFYLYRGKRVIVQDRDFYSRFKKVQPV